MGEVEAIPPLAMYFPPSQYQKKIRIATRCFITETLKTFKALKPKMTKKEWLWFERHPQFRHILHMPEYNNHKVQGMWMLLLRNIRIAKKKEAWFGVNGVPIRYGIREHALISGLNCRNYPLNWKEMGSMRFVNNYFGTGATIRFVDVKAKIWQMEPSTDRLKMLVLYFLCSIIGCQTKIGSDGPSVDPFFLRVVDDLKLCQTFPWGRLSFDQMLREIAHTMDHFGGEVKENVLWPIPGFCFPLELLAFEAIPELHVKFRDWVVGGESNCPRMCKSKFKKGVMTGFPLSSIYEELGKSKLIESILVPNVGEEELLHEIIEAEDDEDVHDPIVDSWTKSLRVGHEICFEKMYEEDICSRVKEEVIEEEKEEVKEDEVIRTLPCTQPPQSLEGRIEELEHTVRMLVAKVAQLEGKAGEGSKKSKKSKKEGKKRAREE